MHAYRCYLMNTAKAITAVEVIECADDDEAQQGALRLLRERTPYAVEVWDRARMVFDTRYCDPKADPADRPYRAVPAG